MAEQPPASPQQDDVQTSSSQPATAEGVPIESDEPRLGAPLAAYFARRWRDLPPAADLDADDTARSSSGYAGEQASSHSEQPMLSTRFVAPETKLMHKSTSAPKLASVFIAGAISMIVVGGLLELVCALSRFPARPRLESELDDGREMSLGELMQALRRVDERLKASEPRRYSPLRPRERASFPAMQRTDRVLL